MSKSKYFWFSLREYSDHDVKHLSENHDGVKYLVFATKQKNGVAFLHGLVCFEEKVSFSTVTRLTHGAHVKIEQCKSFYSGVQRYKRIFDCVEVGSLRQPRKSVAGKVSNLQAEPKPSWRSSLREGLGALSRVSATVASVSNTIASKLT